jgi:hypothetical protein
MKFVQRTGAKQWKLDLDMKTHGSATLLFACENCNPLQFGHVIHQLGGINNTMRQCCFFAIALAALAQEPEPAIRTDVKLVPVTCCC